MKLRHHLERVELDQGIILLQGWVALDGHPGQQPTLQLHGRDPQGKAWVQDLAFNRDRPDVAGELGLSPAFQRCGFFYYAAVPEGQVLELCAHTDGARLSLHRWADPLDQNSNTAPFPTRLHQHLRTWRYFLGRSWSLLRSGQWRGFKERATRHARSAWQVAQLALKPAAAAQPETTPPWDCLVVDHDLGGGANQYRRHQLAQELLAASGQDSRVALLTFSVLTLQYVVYRILPEQRQELVTRGTWSQLQAWLQRSRIAHIFYNNAVSFPQALPLVIVPQDLPLVSVLIRTMGDPRLEQAIASVCAQNYPQLELIVAAATPDLVPPAWLSVLSRKADWLACTEQPGFIAAGNRALRHARGQYFLVLEESSFLPPGHLTELVTLLREQPSMRAASMTPQFQQLHALLFASTLFHQDGCAWRNAVARESDEDFWLQICLHTRLAQPSGPAFDLPDWQQRYNQSQQELMIAQSQLTQIHNSRAWRWVQKLRDIQKRLVSKGGV